MAKNNKHEIADEVNENELRRQRALTDYERRVQSIRDLATMTDTQAWQDFHADIQQQINKHAYDVLNVEAPREVIRHQEGVKILRSMVDKVREPIDDLNKLINNYPLFSPEMKIRAEWNTALGRVEIREI